ncbi:hypothetical protein A5893_00545 [Pedobacter psychrophilus]|uniref:Antitoxin n=1 Tax=Pedobacter psychrophilus TaxID=1826909 RepID=A0A179DMH3_9SPHI|nr:DUF433 domain-containing protein [Pedobacter psychrophilus]OAQ41633.1 hypothetical protein A5893_00545 [Pedobacter psychrophilus]
MDYREHIQINSEIRFGKPCIKGTRIAIYDILSWLSEGMSIREIISDFPQLREGDILATLAYSEY